MAASLRYTHALVCRVPVSFRTRGEVELESARREHEGIVRTLRELGLDVLELPADEDSPECAFVDDTAIVCNGIALMARPGLAARRNEVETVRAVLKKELDMPIIEIADEKARLEGGDVLFTGREFFVGISDWTNEGGARAVAAAFPEFPCSPVKVSDGRHLKGVVSMAGVDVMCVGASPAAQEVIKRIEREATFSYRTLTVAEDAGANVLHVNGTLVHRPPLECPASCKVFEERVDFARKCVGVSELSKVGSGLTSCCLLFRRGRRCRSL